MKKWSCLLLRWEGSRKNRFAGKIKSWVWGMLHVRCLPAPKWRNWVGKWICNTDFSSKVQTEEKKSVIKPWRGSEHSYREETKDQASDSPGSEVRKKGQMSEADYKAVTTEVGRKPWVLEGKWTKDVQEEEAILSTRCWLTDAVR